MTLPLKKNYKPMEANPASELPEGREWQYEPKWDGFRCLAFRDGDRIDLQSKSQKPLTRYFPELQKALTELRAKQFVLDGEIVIPIDGQLSFDDLLQRIHPAESRVRKLAEATSCVYIVFDLLVDETGKSLVGLALEERRKAPGRFAKKYFRKGGLLRLSPTTPDFSVARKWFRMGVGLDGIVAKGNDSRLPVRQSHRNAEDQEATHRRLRRRRIPLSRKEAPGRIATARPLQ